MTTVLRRAFIWASIGALFVDQTTKLVVYGMFGGGGGDKSVAILGQVLRISFTINTRGVFGVSFGGPIFHFVLQVVGVGLVIYFGIRTRERWLGSAYGVILGGALGNLIDRVRLGYVIDFIDFGIPAINFRWFTFNLADAFIVVGVLMIVFYEVGLGFRSKRKPGVREWSEVKGVGE